MKKYLNFTAVAYNTDDLMGYGLAWFSLVPQCLIVVELTAFLLAETRKRRLQAGSILMGQIFNETINNALKKIIRQPRPFNSGRNDYGMPSSHAQFMGFLMVVLFVMTTNSSNNRSFALIWTLRMAMIASAVFTMISRVYLEYHDRAQVMIGALIGITVGFLWKRLYHSTLRHTLKTE